MKRYTQMEMDSILRLFSDDSERKKYVQDQVFLEWERNHYRGTFEGATGSGKSRVGVMAVQREFRNNLTATVYICVPTETLRDTEWPDEFKKWGATDLIPKVKFVCHVSMEDIREKGEIDLVILDEGHHLTPKMNALFERHKVYNVLCLTATLPTLKEDPVRRGMLDKLCPSFFQITLEDGIYLKLVTDFAVSVLLFDLDSTHMIIESGDEKHKSVTTEASHYLFLTKKINKMMRMVRYPLAKFKWINKRIELIMNLPTKKQLAKEVMAQILDEGKRTLIFCGSIEQCNELCGENVYHSKSGNTALEKFRNKEISYLGCVKALNEGKNLPDIDQAFVVQISSKLRHIVQRIGRAIRWKPGHIANILILVARNTMDETWYKEAFATFDKKRIKTYVLKPQDLSYATKAPGNPGTTSSQPANAGNARENTTDT